MNATDEAMVSRIKRRQANYTAHVVTIGAYDVPWLIDKVRELEAEVEILQGSKMRGATEMREFVNYDFPEVAGLESKSIRVGLDYAYEQVKKFQETFNQPASKCPTKLTRNRVALRASFLDEEVREFLAADNIAEQADAMIDVIYFAIGTLVEMGVEPQPLLDIVQNANMAKLWPDGEPHFNEVGKIIKPPGWKNPHDLIIAEIERQRG